MGALQRHTPYREQANVTPPLTELCCPDEHYGERPIDFRLIHSRGPRSRFRSTGTWPPRKYHGLAAMRGARHLRQPPARTCSTLGARQRYAGGARCGCASTGRAEHPTAAMFAHGGVSRWRLDTHDPQCRAFQDRGGCVSVDSLSPKIPIRGLDAVIPLDMAHRQGCPSGLRATPPGAGRRQAGSEPGARVALRLSVARFVPGASRFYPSPPGCDTESAKRSRRYRESRAALLWFWKISGPDGVPEAEGSPGLARLPPRAFAWQPPIPVDEVYNCRHARSRGRPDILPVYDGMVQASSYEAWTPQLTRRCTTSRRLGGR